jgi:hypothetical protein
METNNTGNDTSAALTETTAVAAALNPCITDTASSGALGPIQDQVVKNFYIALGAIGVTGNLFVVVVMVLCTANMKNKVKRGKNGGGYSFNSEL